MPEERAPSGLPESLETELERLRGLIAEQAAVIAQLRERIRELEARLAKDSHNSSKPPASDPSFKKPPPRTLRRSSGKKPGAQKGHPGTTRDLIADPEHTVVVPLSGACGCGRCLSAASRRSRSRSCPSVVRLPIWWCAVRSPSIGR